MHVRNVRILLAPGTCATEPAEAFVSRAAVMLSLGGGAGGLVEDHNVGGTIVLFRFQPKTRTPFSEQALLYAWH